MVRGRLLAQRRCHRRERQDRRSRRNPSEKRQCGPATSIFCYLLYLVELVHLAKTKVPRIQQNQHVLPALHQLVAVFKIGAGDVEGDVEDAAVQVQVELEVPALSAEEKSPTRGENSSQAP